MTDQHIFFVKYLKGKRIWPWTLLLALSLQSCFVAKQYRRPDLELENLYRNFDRQDSTTLAAIPWQELFPDPQLRTLIKEGLENNLLLDSAYENVRIAQANFKQGRAMYLPSINALANVSSSDFSENSATGRQFANITEGDEQNDSRRNQYEVLGTLSWEADIWGRIRSVSQARRAALFQNEAAFRAIQTRLIAMIASYYYQLLGLDAQLDITEQTVETRLQSLRTIEKLKESGNETGLAVKQQEAQIYTAKILQVDLEQRIALVEDSLSNLLAREPGAIERGKLENQQIGVDVSTGVPSQLLRNRPDVMEAEYAFANAFQLTNAAKADFYPRITISAELGYQSLMLTNWLSSASFYNSIVGGLTAPIFRQRQIRTNYEIAQAEQRQTLAIFEQTLLDAGREVSDALINYNASKKKLGLRRQQVETLTTAEDYANKLLKNGYANYLEVLRATDEKLAAQIEMINTHFNNLNSLVSLYRALGGGWEMQDEPQEADD